MSSNPDPGSLTVKSGIPYIFLHTLAHSCSREQQEDKVFHALLKLCYGLEERLLNASPEEVELIADLVSVANYCNLYLMLVYIFLQIQKGASGSRADDTKGMKGAVIDWITPDGQMLNPPLSRKYKSERGFRHDRTGALLCPTGVDWNIPM